MGNQPAVAAHVQMTQEEVAIVTENILKQKVGHNPKAMKRYHEMLQKRRSKEDQNKTERTTTQESQQRDEHDDDNKIILKYGRIAVGAAVRWKRVRSNEQREEGVGQTEQHMEQ